MLTSKRRFELRGAAGLTQQEMATLLGVGVATIPRWENSAGSRPTGLPLQIYEVMDVLNRRRIDLREVGRRLRMNGNVAVIRWLLNRVADAGKVGVA